MNDLKTHRCGCGTEHRGPRCDAWQPIETAPKDVMHTIIVWTPEGAQLAWWSEGNLCWLEQGSGKHLWDEPTHWMPLPEPPTSVSGQEKE